MAKCALCLGTGLMMVEINGRPSYETTCMKCSGDGKDPLSFKDVLNDFNSVNHPGHYQSDYVCPKCERPVEAIDICRYMNFNLGNVLKYIWRAGKKGNTVEDLEKAVWYLKNEIERVKK